MYRQGNLRKWIQYEDGGEEYMKSFMDPNQQKASSRTGERDSFPFGAPPKRDDVYVMDEIPKNHPPRLPDFSRRPPLDVVLCDGANCPENRTQGKPDDDLRGLSGHAAANLVSGVVRMLDNGFDPNKKPAPQSNPTVFRQPVPGSGGIWGDERISRDAGVLYATDSHAAQEGKSGQTRQQPAQPWRKPGSLLSDPAYWLNNQDQHPAPAGKLKQAEQQSNAKNPLERIYNGAGQALDKGMEAAGQATGKAWDALGDPKIREGMAKAVKDGSKGAREAVAKTVDTFANDPRMQEGLKTFGEYGLKVAALTAMGLTPKEVYGAAGAAMTTWAAANPEKVQAASEFLDLAVGYNVPGPPPVSKAGYTGFGIHAAKDIYEKIRDE